MIAQLSAPVFACRFPPALALRAPVRVGFAFQSAHELQPPRIFQDHPQERRTPMATSTPMLRQYHELKQQHPGTLLFFRLGDFYELFYDDAVTGARELQITLTARHKERGDPIPMCGVPHHAAQGHIARLVRKGFRVAICEQTEDPTKTKKLVRREVVRIITPGTALDPQMVAPGESVYLAAVCAS